MPTAQIIIPARLASTRLPRKLLLCETGQPLIQHVYEAALRSARASGVCVAADCVEIIEAVRAFGGRAELTDPHAPSGTDRVAQLARKMTRADIIVNLAGESIGDRRWTLARKDALVQSRLLATRSLARFVKQSSPPPAAFISASATGFYGDAGSDVLDVEVRLGQHAPRLAVIGGDTDA